MPKKPKALQLEEKIKRLIEKNEEVCLIKEISRLRNILPPSQPTSIPDQNNYYKF